MNKNNKMKNRGFVTEALVTIAALGALGLAYGAHKLDNYIAKQVDERTQLAVDQATQEFEDSFGAYGTTGGGTYRLKASIGTSNTTINLSSFKEPVSNIAYTMSYLDTTVAYGTIDPLTDRPEFISFTGITQNSDGSATLTGVTRGLTRTPQGEACTASSTLAIRHAGQAAFILSDSPCHFAEYPVKRNDESITGNWTVNTPTAASQIANKSYVDSLVNGGAVSTDRAVVAATAGETIATGTIVYFNRFEAEWRKADADTASTTHNVLIGITQGAGIDGGSISGGVLLIGIDTNQGSALTNGQKLYLSGTAGATSTSPGTFSRLLGVVRDNNEFYFDPTMLNEEGFFTHASSTTLIVTNSTTTNATTTRIAVSNNLYGPDGVGRISTTTIYASGNHTWTKPDGARMVCLLVIGGGAGGITANGNPGGGGGGGGGLVTGCYSASLATSTIHLSVGAGGAAGTIGATSTITAFSLSAPPGRPGSGGTGGTGGVYIAALHGGQSGVNGGTGGNGGTSTAGGQGGGGGGGAAGGNNGTNGINGASGDPGEGGAGGTLTNVNYSAQQGTGGQGADGRLLSAGNVENGDPGNNYGGGGGGGSGDIDTSGTGGAGAGGVIVITTLF